MRVYVVLDRYITRHVGEDRKIVGIYPSYDAAYDCAVRLRRVKNKFHDLFVVPCDSCPFCDWTSFRGFDEEKGE